MDTSYIKEGYLMAVKQAVYQVNNGTDFDEIHFRTSEQMLVDILQS